jgi:plastocyanin
MPDVTEPVTSGAPVTGPNSYQFTFTTLGTYVYYCVVHGLPGRSGMFGTVTVM